MVVSIALVIKREGHIVARSAQVPIQMVMILYRADLLHFLFGSWNGTVPTVTLLRGDGDLSCVNPRNKLRQRVLLPLGRKSGVSSENQLHIVSLIMGRGFYLIASYFGFVTKLVAVGYLACCPVSVGGVPGLHRPGQCARDCCGK